MANPIFIKPNDTASVSVNSGTWVNEANVFDDQPSVAARSTVTGVASLDFDFGTGTPPSIDFIGAFYTNWNGGDFGLSIQNDGDPAFGSPSVDITQQAPVAGIHNTWPRSHLYHFLSTPGTERYWRIFFTVTFALAPNRTFLDVGRLVLGTAYQPTRGHDLDWSSQWIDSSKVERSIGGAAYTNPLGMHRRISLGLSFLDEDEMFDNVDVMQKDVGLFGPLVVVHDPTNSPATVQDQMRGTVYGTMQSLPPIQHRVRSLYQSRYVVDEWEKP